ncbi:hypothetical protein D7319_14880 [Streptomyces radicis]|uniref:Inosine/uridine-preferring nucleoside hydrolase domain-containing protein n=1 Tax=Streptomyces radicis TaxID=1750517 RepID=A0A3A9W8J9_9ACTN|nr:hypothetical protein D7319_14880 [Streptomyces radicis]RKN21831.1 hypothetical protein D7318_15835 [Streptomyces radicis]
MPPGEGLPPWGPERDWNIQWDTHAAAAVVAAAGHLTLVTLPATLSAWLTRRDLPRLRRAGAMGHILARQAEARAVDADMTTLGQDHPGLPDDLLNFHYDPVTCAIAAGWLGAETAERHLTTVLRDGVLHFEPDPAPDAECPVTVVTRVDGRAFGPLWLDAVEAAATARGAE